jgi:hypothetical protein
MPADAIKMGIDYTTLANQTVVGGMGGDSVSFRESAVLAFDEPNRSLIRYYFVTILIPEPKPDLMHMPPIIGRDVLDQWHMNYDPTKNNLTFTVRTADHTIKTN